jgi:hypothetical protein
MSIIEDLYEFFPNEIVFKILSYQPNKTATLMRIYWHKKSFAASVSLINKYYREMNEFEDETTALFGFYDWYMYNESPQWDSNAETQLARETLWYYH